MTSKFRGAYLHVLPNGVAHLAMHRSGDHYTWGRVSTTIYNIIVGKLWVDQVREKRGGEGGDKLQALFTYLPLTFFSPSSHLTSLVSRKLLTTPLVTSAF